jgi:hypothetical protein
MTPEELEEIPGIGPKMVEKIQDAVVSYYGQYEESVDVPQSEESQRQEPSSETGESEEVEPLAANEAVEVAESETEEVAENASSEVAHSEPADSDHTESARIKEAE